MLLKKVLSVAAIGLALILLPQQRAHAGPDEYIGEIIWVGFNFCPRGTTPADGQLMAISSNSALFSLYGTYYGGDGRTTFGVPDLRGRAPVHSGQGPGLQNYSIGAKGGVERNVLTAANLPSHNHGLGAATVTQKANKNGGTSAEPEGRVLADGQRAAIYTDAAAVPEDEVPLDASSLSVGGTTDNVGSSAAVENRAPYLTIRACIVTQGVFPSRS